MVEIHVCFIHGGEFSKVLKMKNHASYHMTRGSSTKNNYFYRSLAVLDLLDFSELFSELFSEFFMCNPEVILNMKSEDNMLNTKYDSSWMDRYCTYIRTALII